MTRAVAFRAFGVAALVLGMPGMSTAQEDVRAAAALFPDTVHVGQPFRVGVTVRTPGGAEVRLPGILETTEDLEQAGEAEVGKRRPLTGASRAYYRMVAWTAGEHEVPPIKVEVFMSEDAEPLEVLVPVPTLTVETVLPAEIAGLELRRALPYLNPLPFPLLLILALVALLVGLWAYRKYRKGAEEEPEEVPRELTAWERALEELRKLVEGWRAGDLALDAFCDGLEAVLRRYLEATEAWPPGVPTREVVNGNRGLTRALYYSARVRFARLGGGYGGPIEASDACGAWIASRHEPVGEEVS